MLRIGNLASAAARKALEMNPDAAFATGQAIADLAPFEEIVGKVADALTEIGTQNVRSAFLGLGIKDPALINQAIAEVTKYARDRAAQMVGKQWLADVLVDDPQAEMAITSLTEKGIGEAVANVLEAYETGEIDAITTAAMSEELLAQYAFSQERAGVIAEFEGRRAAMRGFLSAWTAAGITGKMNILSIDHEGPCVCDDIEAYGVVDLDSDFGGEGFGPPWHPWCRCWLVGVTADEDLDVDYLDEGFDGGTTTMRAKVDDIFDLAKAY